MNETYRKAEEIDKRYDYLSKKWRKWVAIEDFASNAMNPFIDFDILFGFIVFFKALLILGALIAITAAFEAIPGLEFPTTFIAAAVFYYSSFIALKITARIKSDIYWKKLWNLKPEVKALQDEYFERRCKESNIFDGYIYFTNGMAVGGCGSIIAVDLERDCGSMQVFSKGIGFENDIKEVMHRNFKERRDRILLNDSIASLEFNEKFCVVAEKGTERNCLAYLSPAMQLSLLRKDVIYSYLRRGTDHSLFTIKGNTFSANINHETAPSGYIAYEILSDIVSHSAVEVISAVDRYCEAFPKIAFDVIAEFDEKAAFLGGSVRAQNI